MNHDCNDESSRKVSSAKAILKAYNELISGESDPSARFVVSSKSVVPPTWKVSLTLDLFFPNSFDTFCAA